MEIIERGKAVKEINCDYYGARLKYTASDIHKDYNYFCDSDNIFYYIICPCCGHEKNIDSHVANNSIPTIKAKLDQLKK